jgi:quercetin dioxygenase-like cupin family protein
MDGTHKTGRRFVVRRPDEGKSYWQPVPAGDYAEVMLTPADTGHDGYSTGFQTVAPGGRIRAHSHDAQVELQVCFRGTGHIVIDGETHKLAPGTMCFLGRDALHEIVNDGTDPLVMLWLIAPGGLEDFFAAIGRARTPGEAAPAPFARPADVVEIERSLGLHNTKA